MSLIGASLSEPHTSMIALRMRVCICLCLLGPTIYRKFLNERVFSKIELVAIVSLRVKRRLPGVEMTEVEAHMASYSLFATDHQRQVVHREYKF